MKARARTRRHLRAARSLPVSPVVIPERPMRDYDRLYADALRNIGGTR